MKKIGVVTINYNSDNETHTLLESLKKVHNPGFVLDIIVVDNGSKAPFVLKSQEKEDHIHLVRSDENTGFSGGNNIGIKKSLDRGADYVLIINNDTVVDPQMVENLLEVLERDERIGVVVPKIYFAKGHEFHKDKYTKDELGRVLWYAGGSTDWDNVKSVHRGVDEVDHGQYDTVDEISFATGCCMMLKREVLENVGARCIVPVQGEQRKVSVQYFDDNYFLYYEDADLSERIKNAGYDIFYAPDAVLFHVNAASSGGAGNALQDYFLTRNRMLFGMKYASLRTKLALFRESIRLMMNGRKNQKKGIKDFYLRRFGKGTYFKKGIGARG
jgi:GT2 family glycosyltransferase